MLIRIPEVVPDFATPEVSVLLLQPVEAIKEQVDDDLILDNPVVQPAVAATAEAETADEVVDRKAVDWYSEISVVVADMGPPSTEPAVFNVAQMEKRRRAAEKFAPIPSHEPVPIWDNVTRDMTGRSVLVHGNCERVLNDPNVGSREAFEVFGQYITTCKNYKEKPKTLAWVAEIKRRREGPSRYDRPTAE